MAKKEQKTGYEKEDWLGGAKIDLNKKAPSGNTLREALSFDVFTWFKRDMDAQQQRIDKIIEWEKQYKGHRESKSYPFINAANCAIPFTRSMVDTTTIRVMDVLWGQKKMWIVEAKEADFVPVAKQVEDMLDWWQKDIVGLRKKLFPVLQQALKTGTGIIKLEYTKKKRTVCRYATDEELENKEKKLYNTGEGKAKIVKDTITEYEGPDIYQISREDFVISSESTCVDDAFLCGFRKVMPKTEALRKAESGRFDKDIVENLTSESGPDEVKIERAANQEIEINPQYDREQLKIWELYVRYDIDGDGEEDDIVVWMHEETGTILGAIYNPSFYGHRPFIVFRPSPYEYRFDGEGIVEILEKVQKEIDTLHNLRIDRLHIINNPARFVREDCLIDPADLKNIGVPGKAIMVNADDPGKMMAEMKFSDVYPSTFQEEMILEQKGREAVGVTPQVMGQPTSERPVARDTLALLQESNKKFKFLIDNCREPVGELGYEVVEMVAQYSPEYTYYDYDEMGNKVEQNIAIKPNRYLRDGLNIRVMASSELLNQEVRREIWMYVWSLLSDFYTKNAGILQAVASPDLPNEVKTYFLQVLEVSTRLMNNILEDFNIADPQSYVRGVDPQQAQSLLQQADAMKQMMQQIQQMGQMIQQLQGQLQQQSGTIQEQQGTIQKQWGEMEKQVRTIIDQKIQNASQSSKGNDKSKASR